jgi:hypothetical protein
MHKGLVVGLGLGLAFALLLAAPVRATLPVIEPLLGDCNGDGCVTVNEVVVAVGEGLGTIPVSVCDVRCPQLGVYIDCLLVVVTNAMNSGGNAQCRLPQ